MLDKVTLECVLVTLPSVRVEDCNKYLLFDRATNLIITSDCNKADYLSILVCFLVTELNIPRDMLDDVMFYRKEFYDELFLLDPNHQFRFEKARYLLRCYNDCRRTYVALMCKTIGDLCKIHETSNHRVQRALDSIVIPWNQARFYTPLRDE